MPRTKCTNCSTGIRSSALRKQLLLNSPRYVIDSTRSMQLEFQQHMLSATSNAVLVAVKLKDRQHHGYLQGEMEIETGSFKDVSEKPTPSSSSFVVAGSPSGIAGQRDTPMESSSDSQHNQLLHEVQRIPGGLIDLKDEVECQSIAYIYRQSQTVVEDVCRSADKTDFIAYMIPTC